MQKVVTLNTCCDIPVATHHNQFFLEPPTFGQMQHCLKSDEFFLILQGQIVSHALTGRYSKILTSYAHAYLTYLSRTSRTHRIHQFPSSFHNVFSGTSKPYSIDRFSMGMHTGPIDGLRPGFQSRLGSCPQKMNEWTNHVMRCCENCTFLRLSPPPFTMGAGKWPVIFKLEHNI